MLPLYDPRGKSSAFYTTRRTRKWFYLAALLLSGILVLHRSAPDDWRAVAKEKFRAVQGPFWQPETIWDERAQHVKDAFVGAYGHYQEHAFGADELFPLTNRPRNNFNGWGVSIVDSIDTMILMNLTLQYEQAKQHVSTIDFTHGSDRFVPFFEAIIRYLGGLLSAYSLTKEPIFLSKADDIGRALLPVFNTTSGLPAFSIEPATKNNHQGWSGAMTPLSEMASCQLEYKYLAHLTGRKEYFSAVDHITTLMQEQQLTTGLWYTWWNQQSGTQYEEMSSNPISIGAMSDSAYEYLLKGYLLSGKTEKRLLDMYIKSLRGLIHHLMYISKTRHLLYVTDIDQSGPSGKLEHLSCFFPGLIALGLHILPDSIYESADEKLIFESAAEGLTYTCWVLYADQATGVGPDEVVFEPYGEDDDDAESNKWESGRWMNHVNEWIHLGKPAGGLKGVHGLSPPRRGNVDLPLDYAHKRTDYMMRPETIESVYLMWKTTGNSIWRERGWEMFQGVQQYSTVPGGGMATIEDVRTTVFGVRDDMPSYHLAETLKYYYLLFLDDDPLSLDEIVFNTEAHPLPVFKWSSEEISWFKVPV